jgi:hypothetical protein
MNDLGNGNIALLAALIIMMLIAAVFDYRLQISTDGFVFERTNSEQLVQSKRSP